MENKKRKKILLVLHLPPPYGGGEVRSLKVYNSFKEKEYINIVSITRKRASKKSQGKVTTENILISLINVFRILFRMICVLPEKIYIGIPKDFFSFVRTSIIILFANIIGTKVYGELAGMSFRFMGDNNKWRYKYGKFVFKKICSMRLLGKNIEEYGNQMGFKKIVIFDNGIDVPENYRISDGIIFNEELKMLYVGSLEKLKGIYRIIEGLKICRQKNINFKFTFMGEWVNESTKNKVSRLIDEYGLKSNINFSGLKIDNEKWEIYSQNVLLVHPTFWDGQPISILEAMGLGLGVISTRVGAIPDTLTDGHNGIILKENTPEYLFDAIKKIYYDRMLLRSFSVNNIETFNRKFDSKTFIQNIKNWIED